MKYLEKSEYTTHARAASQMMKKIDGKNWPLLMERACFGRNREARERARVLCLQ